MRTENLDPDFILNERRKAVEQSIRKLSHAELAAVGETLFAKNAAHPWKQSFDQFLSDNPYGSFYHGTTHDQFQVVYCSEQDKGIWFLPEKGMGILGQRGRTAMKEIIKHL